MSTVDAFFSSPSIRFILLLSHKLFLDPVSLPVRPACVMRSVSAHLAHRGRQRGEVQTRCSPQTHQTCSGDWNYDANTLGERSGVTERHKLLKPSTFPQSYTTVITMSSLEKEVNLFLRVSCRQSARPAQAGERDK